MRKASNIINTQFNWLTCLERPVSEYAQTEQDFSKTIIPFPADVGYAWMKSMLLPLNIILRRAFHHFEPKMSGQLIDLGICKENYTEPSLMVISTKTGRFHILDDRIEVNFVSSSAGCLFQHTDYIINAAKLDAATDVEVFAVIITIPVLVELLGEDLAKQLLQKLKIAPMPSGAVNPIPHHISKILYSSMPEHLTGNMGRLFAQAKVLEYLCALSEHFTDIGKASDSKFGNGTKNQNVIERMHDELELLEGNVPTLDQLSQKYGMSARVLNRQFKHIYGKSIFNYISELRLNEAHDALVKSNTPMKTLAANLGYSHVNNFISAFKKQFGYSPGSLRKKT